MDRPDILRGYKMVILGLILVLFAIGIFMTAENVMIEPLGFIIGKYRPKNEGLSGKGKDLVD